MGSQRAKKVVSDSPGQGDFAIGLARRVVGLVEMTCGLVHGSYSLPEWQAVKWTFFAPWVDFQLNYLSLQLHSISDQSTEFTLLL